MAKWTPKLDNKDQTPLLEEMEPRILFSADLPNAGTEAVQEIAPEVEQRVVETTEAEFEIIILNEDELEDSETSFIFIDEDELSALPSSLDATENSTQKHELIVVDTQVNDYQQLIDDISSSDNQGEREFDILLIDSNEDGINLLTETLEQYQSLNAVHIISHGEAGEIKLGSALLNLDTLQHYNDNIQQWNTSLTSEADLLIYGCDLASNSDGTDFLDQLALLTHADIAASDDLTGHTTLGGDWKLEYSVGAIETVIPFSETLQQNWGHVLDVTVDNTSTDTGATGVTSDSSTNHTTSGSNRLMLVGVSFGRDNGDTVDSVTYNGNNLTFIGAQDTSDNNKARVEIWAMIAPDLGTHEVVVNISGTNHEGFTYGVVTFNGVDQSTPLGTFASAEGDSSTASVTVASSVGAEVFGVVAAEHNSDREIVPGAGQSELWDLFRDQANGGGSLEAGAASVVTDFDFGATDKWAVAGVSINPFIAQTYLDQFEGIDFSGDDGTLSWSNDWQETGEPGGESGPVGGEVFAAAGLGEQGLYVGMDSEAWRQMDLSSATSASLSIDVARLDFEAGDSVTLDISTDGISWTTLDSFSGAGADTTLTNYSYDISSYIDTDTRVRISGATLDNANDFLFVDNVRVELDADSYQEISSEGSGSAVATAMDASGNYVTVYSADGKDGDGWGVFAQRYNASGAAVGAEIRVSQTTSDNQRYASVGMSDTGKFVVTWTSHNQDGTSSSVYARQFDADGWAVDDEFRVNTENTGAQSNASIDVDSAGDFIIVWQGNGVDGSTSDPDDQGIFYRRFNADGSSIDATEELAHTATDGGTNEHDAVVAWLTGGKFVIAWDEGSHTYFTRFANDGSELSPTEVSPNDESGLGTSGLSIDSNSSGQFVIGYKDALGGTYVRSFNEDGSNLYSNGEIGNGANPDAWNNAGSFGSANVSVAIDDTGKVLVAFQTSSSGGDIQLQVINTDGSDDGAQVTVVSDAGDQNMPALAILDVDNYALAWSDTTTSVVANSVITTNLPPVNSVPVAQNTPINSSLVFSNSNGNAISISDPDAGSNIVEVTLTATNGTATITGATGDPIPVTANTSNAQSGSVIARANDGSMVAAWASQNQDGDGWGIYALRYNTAGSPVGSEFQVNTTTASDQTEPAIAMDDAGNFVVTWQSTGQDGSTEGIFAQRFNSSGIAQGSEFQVNSYTTGDQTSPEVAMDADGDFVIVWQSDAQDGDKWGIYGQRYNAAGVAQGGEFLINTTTNKEQYEPAVAMADDNSFIVVWSDKNLDGSNLGVVGQRFDASGNTIGSEFVVNSYTSAQQQSPRVAMDATGDFVITWQSQGQDGANLGVFAQRYDSAAVAQGSEFQVNTYTTSDQQTPDIAMAANGEFTIVWQSMSQDGDSWGIYAQDFDASGNTVGSETQVNIATTGPQSGPKLAMNSLGDYLVIWSGESPEDDDGVSAQRFLSAGGITFTAGTGSDDTTMTFQGTITEINQALEGLTFDPTAGYSGAATLQIVTNDLGNTGGSAQSDNDTISITVVDTGAPILSLDVDDSSGAGGDNFTTGFTEDAGAVLVADADASLAAPNGGNIDTLTVRITNALDSNFESLAADTSGTSITAVYNAGLATLYLTGTDTDANYQQVLRTVEYNNTSQAPNTTGRIISFLAHDGTANGNTATTTVSITAVNDDPTIDSSATVSLDENNIEVSTVTASDVDGDTPTFSITGGADQSLFQIDSSTGVLTFLSAPDYETPTDSNTDNDHTVEVTADDGNGGTIAQTITVTITDQTTVNFQSLLFTTEGDVASGPDIGAWSSGGVIQLSNPNLAIEPGTSDGTFSNTFDIDTFAALNGDGDTRVSSLHFVSQPVMIAGSYMLLPGDVLFSVRDSETFTNSDNVTTLSVTDSDVVVFRPDDLGNYSAGGTFEILLENPVGVEIRGLSLVENDTAVGDAQLSAGTFLITMQGESGNIFHITPTGVGGSTSIAETQPGTLLIDGSDIGLLDWVVGIELIETDSEIGGQALNAGQILLTQISAATVGSNSLAMGEYDIAVLDVTATGESTTAATASLFLEGADLGLDTAIASPFSLAIVPGTNQAPTITSDGGGASASTNVAENTTAVTTVVATDANLDTVTYSITGGTDASSFSIDSNSGALTFSAAPDFESPGDSDTNNIYEVIVTASDGIGGIVIQTIQVTVTNANESHTGGVTISDTSPLKGYTVTAGNTISDPDGIATLSYQWMRGGVDIAGATSSNYTPVQADVGSALSVRTEVTDNSGASYAVVSASTSNVDLPYYLDDFSTADFTGDQGTLNWTNDWQQIGEVDGPVSGNVITHTYLTEDVLRIEGDGNGVWRSADLTGATGASISYDFARDGMDAGDSVVIEVSTDGGSNWIELGRQEGPATDAAFVTVSYNLSPYINSDTRIRFVATSMDQGNDYFYVDNVRIDIDLINSTPTANATAGAPYAINEGESVTLDASASSDVDGDTLNYLWDLNNNGVYGDVIGETPIVDWATIQSAGIGDDGNYTIGLKVDDGKGGVATTTANLAITNVAPTVSVTGDSTIAAGATYTLNFSATDPGDDTISGWSINWGDGTIDTVAGSATSATHVYTNTGFTNNISIAAIDEDSTTGHIHNNLYVANYDMDSGVYRIQGNWGAAAVEFGSDGQIDMALQPIIGPDGYVYVVGENSSNVRVFDGSDGSFIREAVATNADGLGEAGGIAFGPDGYLYVADYTNNTVKIYDPNTGAYQGDLVNGAADGLTQAFGLIFTDDGHLLVASYDQNQVYRYDATNGNFVDIFVTTGDNGGLNNPEQFIFGPDGNLYVASAGTDQVLRFNGSTGAFIDDFVTATLGTLNSPNGLAFGPDGLLYVSSFQNDKILRYNGSTGAFVDEYATGVDKPVYMTFAADVQVAVTGNAGAISTATSIVADGDAESAWDAATQYSISNLSSGTVDNTTDLSGRWKSMWDSNYLYVLYNVTDDSILNDSAQLWHDDVIDLFVNADLSAGSSYDGVNDYQLIIRPDDNVLSAGYNSVTDLTGILHGVSTTAGGYVVEIAVPWSLLGIVPSDGAIIGFDAHIGDDDDGGTRDGKLAWNDDNDQAATDPSTFGSVQLNANPDHHPVITGSASFNVDRNAANATVVGNIDANDGDGGANDNGITYSITANVNGDGDGNDAFFIDSGTGEIRVNDSGDLDFTSEDTLEITIQADDGVNQTTKTVVITKNNEVPVAVDDSYSLDENGSLVSAADWIDQAWSYRTDITFDNSSRGETFTDMPVLITLNASNIDYSKTQDSGEDLRFFTSGGIIINHQIEHWDESGNSYVWISIPQISAGATTDTITLYYGNDAATDGSTTDGYWNTDYAAVYHMENGSDSSSNGNDGSLSNTSTATSYTGDALDFNGTDSSVNINNSASLENIFDGGGTVSAWINPSSWGENGYGRIVNKADTTQANVGWSLEVKQATQSVIFEHGFDGSIGRWEINSSIALDTWHMVTVVYDSSSAANDPQIYINGVAQSLTELSVPSGTAQSDSGNSISIGNRAGATDRTFDGLIDNVQFLSTTQSADWVDAQYASYTGSLMSFGAKETNLNVLNNDSDADADSMTVVLATGPSNAASFNLNADGSFDYTPTAGFSGTDSFTYRADDSVAGTSSLATVTIVVNDDNDLPVAGDDSYVVTQDSTINIDPVAGLLANDSDLDGDAISIQYYTLPSHGTLNINPDGSFDYTPDAGYSGADSFTYVITDGKETITNKWNFDGNAQDAVGSADGTMSGVSLTGGAFNYGLNFDGNDYITLPDVDYNDEFTLSLWFSFDNSTGNGYNYLYSHSDFGNPTTTNGLTILLVQDSAPSPSTGKLRTVFNDSNDTNDYYGLDIDVSDHSLADGQWHQYTLSVSEEGGAQVYIDGQLLASNNHGGDAMDPTGNVYIGARNDLSASRFHEGGVDNVQLHSTALDAQEVSNLYDGGSAKATVSLTVNVPPTTTGMSDIDVIMDSSDRLINLASLFSDAEDASGDLAYSITANDNAALVSSSIDNSTDMLTLSFAGGQTGVSNITIRATDSGGSSVDASFRVTVLSAEGVTQTIPSTETVTEDGTLTFSTGNGNEISVGVGSTGDDLVRVSLSVTDGVLNLASVSGITFDSGANGSNNMVMIGLESNLNTALNGLTFTPDPEFNGSVNLQISSDLAYGMLAQYSFDDAANLGNNDSPYGVNNALNTGSVATNDATQGDVAQLDGNDYLRVNSDFGTPANLTLAAWVNLDDTFNNGDVISLGGSVTIRVDDTNTGNGVTGFYNGATWNHTNAGLQISGTGWHHIAYSIDSVTDLQTIYVDGIAMTTTNFTDAINYTQGHTTIGSHQNQASYFLNGSLNDVRIYDRTLTDDEIGALALNQSSVSNSVTLNVNAINDAPTSAGIADIVVNEDAADNVIDLFATFADIEDADTALVFSVTNDNTALVSTNIDSAGGTLTLSYATDSHGLANLTVRATDSNGVFIESHFTATVNSVNDLPAITSSASFSLSENQTAVGNVTASDADLPSDVLNFSISGGADAALMSIDPVTGLLSFINAPDYEIFEDANADGIYDIIVSATDSAGGFDSIAISVTVDDINEAPTATNVNTSVSYTEDTALSLGDIFISDVDSNTVSINLTLSEPLAGVLTTDVSVAGITDIVIPNSAEDGTWGATGTLAQINTLLAQLMFVPTQDSNLNTNLRIEISDGINPTVIGTRTIIAIPVADTPVVGEASTGRNSLTPAIQISPNPDDGNEVTHFQITEIVNGTLYLVDGGTPIAEGDFITVIQGSSGVQFLPDPNSTGNGSFAVQSSEDGISPSPQSSPIYSNVTIVTPISTPDSSEPESEIEEVQLEEPVLEIENPVVTDQEQIERVENKEIVAPPAQEKPTDDQEETSDSVRGVAAINQSFKNNEILLEDDRKHLQLKSIVTRESEISTSKLLDLFLEQIQLKSAEITHSSYEQLFNSLAKLREEQASHVVMGDRVIGSAVTVTSGLTVGYVVWMLRGGMLLSSVMVSLPAWQIADPLPILAGGKNADEDEESLESIIEDGKKKSVRDSDKANMEIHA